MSDSEEQPWSDNPNAPKIPHILYLTEKANLAGVLLASILYGMLIVLFFKCMAALFNPVNRKGEGIKWGFVCYSLVMFSLATVFTAITLDFQSISYIDNREFPGIEGRLPPGPLGYQDSIIHSTAVKVHNITFVLGGWLADGLLLYRCYIIYSSKFWIVAFPFLMYLGSVAMGMLMVYQTQHSGFGTVWFGLPYLSISVSLNVLLTLMIVIRLILHARNVRNATGSSGGIGGVYKAIATMLIESCALYAVNSLLVIGALEGGSYTTNIFMPMLAEIQVIAPLLITQRVANRSAFTSDTTPTGPAIGSFHARTRGGTTGGSVTHPGGYPMSSADGYGQDSGDFVVEVEGAIEFRNDKV